MIARIRDRIAGAGVAYFDETGFRTAGRLHWMHSASTATDVLLTVHPRRGVKGMDAAGVLPRFTGVAVHDAWAPYDTYTDATHALCNAHAVRERVYVIDTAPTHVADLADQAITAMVKIKELIGQPTTTGANPTPRPSTPTSACSARPPYWERPRPQPAPRSWNAKTTPCSPA